MRSWRLLMVSVTQSWLELSLTTNMRRNAQKITQNALFQAHNGPGGGIHLLDYLCHSFRYPATEITCASTCDVGHDGRKGVIATRQDKSSRSSSWE
jgi:hypothetical protein